MGDPLISDDTLSAAALAPKKTTGDEGSVEEKSIDELIAADRYAQARQASTGAPFGMQIATLRFPDAR